LGGIQLPDLAVPLGTFTGWNYQLPLRANFDYLSGLVGSFIPLPWHAKDRKTSGDERLSISERYSGREDYLDKVRMSAQSLVLRRLLRTEDVNAVVEQSAARWDYLTSPQK
jgi:alpha/beta hydrolase family protein